MSLRAALPQLRAQRSGLVMTISSTAGIASTGDFLTAYAASKFGVEGFMEALASEIAPFGIRTMLVEPGFFRTELLTPESTQYAPPSIPDYADRTAATIEAWQRHGREAGGGDPSKLAAAQAQAPPPSSNHRHASPPARTPSSSSRPRPAPSWSRPTLIESCPPASLTATPDQSLYAPEQPARSLRDIRSCRVEGGHARPVMPPSRSSRDQQWWAPAAADQSADRDLASARSPGRLQRKRPPGQQLVRFS